MEMKSCSECGCLLVCFAFVGALSLPALCAQKPDSSPYQEGIRLLRNQDWAGAAKALERALKRGTEKC